LSAKHALLGLLLDRPGYSYELGDRLQHRLGPSWEVNPGQLYQTMARLERDGLIEIVQDNVHHQERRVYAITTDGIEEFERWFDEISGQPRPSRRPLLVKVTLAGPERLERALGQLAEYERDRAEGLAELLARRDAIDLTRRRADDMLLHLNLTYEVIQLEGDLRWAEHALEVVAALFDQRVLWPSADQRASAREHGGSERLRREAREELFKRLSDGPLHSVPRGGPV